jgi:hypothetical protein
VGDEAFLEGFLAAHPVGEAVGDLVRAEGLRGEIAVAPLPAEVDGVLSTVEERFAHLAPTQGLRFRSSSNVEDIEGFNGAGLYASYSGFIHPENDPDGRTVSWAMRQVWASYWGFEAFEERHLAGIDHRAGAMAVLVHPRFDDTHELANGVVTGTRMPPGGEVVFEMVVNAGPGAISVTNPPTDPCYVVLPEVSVVTEYADGSVDVERMQGSTELIEGEWVLTEDDLLALLTDVSGVVERWIGLENDRLLTVQRRSTLTLDLEFRTMDQGWPALKKGEHAGPRLVLKQARSLEPSTGHLPDSVTSAPFPRDVLARAVAVEEVQCRGDAVDLDVLTATTNPLVPPDLGYAVDPFVAAFQMTVHVAMPFLGVEEGANLEYDHLDGELWLTADPWSFGGTLDREAIDLDEVVFDLTEGTYLFSAGETSVLGEGLTCSILTVHASEDGYLSAFFDDS